MIIFVDQEYGYKSEAVDSPWTPEQLKAWWAAQENITCLRDEEIASQIPGQRRPMDEEWFKEWQANGSKKADAILHIHEDEDSSLQVMEDGDLRVHFHKTHPHAPAIAVSELKGMKIRISNETGFVDIPRSLLPALIKSLQNQAK